MDQFGWVPITGGVWKLARKDPTEGEHLVPVVNTYLLGQPGGDDVSLVDPGFLGSEAEILQAMSLTGIAAGDVRRILLTHTHVDHFGCVPHLLASLPHCEVWCHHTEATALEQGDERTVFGNAEHGRFFRQRFDLTAGHYCLRVQRKLEHSDPFIVGKDQWTVVHTPGHSRGSICLYCQQREILISGDTVFADGAVGRWDMHGADRRQLRQSVASLSQLRLRLLLPGHGPAGLTLVDSRSAPCRLGNKH